MSKFDEIYEHCKNEYNEGRNSPMANEQAIVYINRAKKGYSDIHFIKAFDKAIEALEKQISKKPIMIDKGVYSCRGCGQVLMSWEQDYCFKCGQRIDWSDEDAK